MTINTDNEVLMISNVSSNVKKFIEKKSAKVSMLDADHKDIMDIKWDNTTDCNKDYYVVDDDEKSIQFLLKNIVRDHKEVYLKTEGEESLRFVVMNTINGSETVIKMLGNGQEYNVVWIKNEEEPYIEIDFKRMDIIISDNVPKKNGISENKIKSDFIINRDLEDVKEKINKEDLPLIAHYADAAGTEVASLKKEMERLLKDIEQEAEPVEEKKMESILARFADIENSIYEKLYKSRSEKIKRIRGMYNG